MERLTKRFTDGTYYCEDIEDVGIKGINAPTYVGKVVDKLADYEDLEEQGLLLRLPCKVGDTVYVDSSVLPIEDMECYEDVDNPIPSYFPSRVVSFRFSKRNWIKVSVRAKWLYECVDDETCPFSVLDCDYREYEKTFSFPLVMLGKTVFLTKEQAEEKAEVKGNGE